MPAEQPRTSHRVPIFPASAEAKAAEALNVLIFAHGGGDAPIHTNQIIPIRASCTRLVDCLFPMQGDHADFSGADSLDGVDYVHPTRVAMLAIVIGRTLDMPRSELISVAMAAALMNVGYLALRRSLLDEPRRLLQGEWEEHIHTHPIRGAAILERSGLPTDCLRAIEEHHERWDGSGYPRGLRGDAIARHARILAVADTYVALRSVRPHRRPLDDKEALGEIAAGRGTLFDPVVVDALTDAVARFADDAQVPNAGPVAEAPAPTEEHARAEREGAGGVDDAVPPTRPQDEEPLEPLPRTSRRTRADRRPPVADPAIAGARTTVALDAPQVAAPTRLPPRERAAGAPAASTAGRQRGRRSRSGGVRRSRLYPGLFAPALYVDAAISGRWRLDRP